MPLSLIFRFVTGHYHATPYGHHVNEGLIEWPPSPWRLLRALVSVGYTYGYWDHTGPSDAGRSIIYKLASELPRYRLPYATSAHSRHYMPISILGTGGVESTMLVFDTWARVRGELAITWDSVDIDESEIPLLTSLVESLNYLGRSESLVAGRVADSKEYVLHSDTSISSDFCPCMAVADSKEYVLHSDCDYGQPDKKVSSEWERVSLLSPVSASDYDVWREREVQHHAAEHYPSDLLECLQVDTSWVRHHGWNQPPGSRRVSYWRPTNAIVINRYVVQKPEPHPQTAVLLSLTHHNHNNYALPDVTRTLPQAEILHRTLIGTAARIGVPPSVLTGCDEHHKPLQDSHKHAHINPLDLDGDGHLDHILIWATSKLGVDAQAAIREVRRTPSKNNPDPLQLALAMTGDLHELSRLPAPYGSHISRLVTGSATWQSLTPLVLPRHIKKRGKNTLEGQIKTELVSRGLPEPTQIELLRWMPTATGNRYWKRFRYFVISRQNGPPPPVAQGFAVKLFFDRKITGPISIGYGSHYGLGLFCHASTSTYARGGGI